MQMICVCFVRACFLLSTSNFVCFVLYFLGFHQEMRLGAQRVREVLCFHCLLEIALLVRRIHHINNWTYAHIAP